MLLIFCDLPRRKVNILLQKQKEKKAHPALVSARNSTLPIAANNHNQLLQDNKARIRADKLEIL